MKNVKKAVSALLIISLLISTVFSMGGCANTTWSSKYNGKQLNAGVYMFYLINAFYEASQAVTDSQSDPFTQQVEGKDFSVWVKDKALDELHRYYAIEEKARELNVTLTEEEKTEVSNTLDTNWPNGYSKICELNHISKESVLAVNENGKLAEKLFKAIYYKGGSSEVSEKELSENFTFISVFSESLGTLETATPNEDGSEGALTDEQKAANTKTTEKNTKIKELFKNTLDEFNKKTGENAYKETWDYFFPKSNDLNADVEGYTQKNSEALPDVNVFPLKENAEEEETATEEDKKTTKALRELANDKATTIESESGMLFAYKTDLFKDRAKFELKQDEIIQGYKSEEYAAMLTDLAAEIKDKIDVNKGLTNKYGAKELVFPEQ